jgi:hypothetical protein
MDMSDIDPATERAGLGHHRTGEASEADTAARWRDLLGHLGGDVAGPLTSALERVQELARTGRIERRALRALREELESARLAGMLGQQLARFGAGRPSQSHERVRLTQALQDVLAQRARETEARDIRLEQTPQPVEVIVDASLLFALLDSVLDWALAHARSSIELRIDLKPWPAHARLGCRFAPCPPDQAAPDASAGGLDSLTWRLIEQTAWTMGLRLERRDGPAQTALTLEFPRTVGEQIEGLSALELDDGVAASAPDSRPMAGSQVLVVAARRELRDELRESIRHLGLIVDCVHSVAEAADFCSEGLPHALIYESSLDGERFQQLRSSVLRDAPDLAFVEIAEDGESLETAGFGGQGQARVSRAAIRNSLPAALLFELSKAL